MLFEGTVTCVQNDLSFSNNIMAETLSLCSGLFFQSVQTYFIKSDFNIFEPMKQFSSS